MHRIVDGDTLPALAETYLGDPSRWRDLLEANRDVLVHPDLLPLGERIRIPLAPPHMREGE
jgi:nucleoid-associated protein YgaU